MFSDLGLIVLCRMEDGVRPNGAGAVQDRYCTSSGRGNRAQGTDARGGPGLEPADARPRRVGLTGQRACRYAESDDSTASSSSLILTNHRGQRVGDAASAVSAPSSRPSPTTLGPAATAAAAARPRPPDPLMHRAR
ncbi:hypothetical protein VTN02DRAFT_6840 [Thermoascus thermophilus]